LPAASQNRETSDREIENYPCMFLIALTESVYLEVARSTIPWSLALAGLKKSPQPLYGSSMRKNYFMSLVIPVVTKRKENTSRLYSPAAILDDESAHAQMETCPAIRLLH